MRKFLLAAGVAALAIATPAFADKGGGGHGGGNGGGGGQKADRAQGGGGQSMKAERGNGGGHQMRQMSNDSGGNGKDHGGGGKAMRQASGDIRAHGHGAQKDLRQAQAHAMREQKSHGNAGHAMREMRADNHRRVEDKNRGLARIEHPRDDNYGQVRIVRRDFNDGLRGLANNCPPGLDKKDNGCLPPGQAAKLLGARLQSNFAETLLPYQYRSWYRDDQQHFYRAGDGYIYQVNRSNNLIDGLIPLFGSGNYYSLGDQWPQSYDFYNVPYQYRDYYADTGGYDYRYSDGAIYRLNSNSGVIDGIVALLAGDLGVGQQLPMGYDAYNVPLDYRDRYYDTADNWYRYNDGYIYQVDPKTRLISAVINAIV
ncbi:MAG: hypothetical protein ABIN83_02830 [Sphingomicrobium sp.]